MTDALAVVKGMIAERAPLTNPNAVQEADALARVIAVADVPEGVVMAVKMFKLYADMALAGGHSVHPINLDRIKENDAWLAAVARLTGEG